MKSEVSSRACPFCSSAMPGEAISCPACGKFSSAKVAAAPYSLDRCNACIASWELRNGALLEPKAWATFVVPVWLRFTVALGLVACGVIYGAAWFGPYGGFALARPSIAFFVLAAALLIGGRLLKEPNDQSPPTTVRAPWIAALGYANNLAVGQLVALLAMMIFAFRGDIDQARWAGIICVALAALLFGSRARTATTTMGVIGLLVVLGLWALGDIAFQIAADQRSRSIAEPFVPIGGVAWTVAVIALVPQLQLLRIGRVGIGQFRGDFTVQLFGSVVPLALTSSVLLVSLYWSITALPYLPVVLTAD